ncbi:hypothetical protein Tco_0885782 [Tanacetum coccineum]
MGGLLGIKLSALSTAKPTVSTARRKQFVLLKITTARLKTAGYKVATAGEKVNAVSTKESFTHKEEMAPMASSDHEAIPYKRGLDTVEAQLVTYRKNEVLFSEEADVLKREVGIKQYEINTLKTEFEKVKQEKDTIDLKIEKFGKASKDLDQLLES